MNKTAIALFNPKYAHNVGGIIRAASCWDVPRLIWSGSRVEHPDEWDNTKKNRIPREERMKGYANVKLEKSERFKDLAKEYTPVAIELVENAENLMDFVHPENAVYVFGPEDGSIPGTILQHCHRFVQIPTKHCLNLSAAVNVVLAHRAQQRYNLHGENITLNEERGWIGY